MGRSLALAFVLLALAGTGLAFVKPWGWPRGDLMRIQSDQAARERAALDRSLLQVKADLARATAAKAEAERLAGLEREQAARKQADLETHAKGVMARAVDAERALSAAQASIVANQAASAAEIARTKADADKAKADARADADKAKAEIQAQAQAQQDALRKELAAATGVRNDLVARLAAIQIDSQRAIEEARAGQPDNAAEAEFEKRLAAARTEAAERFMAASNESDRQITAAKADTARCRAELEKAKVEPAEPPPAPACPPPAPAAAEPAAPSAVIPANEIAQQLAAGGRIALYIPFDTGSAVVKPNAFPSIEPIASALRSDPKLKLLLVGHTDSQGDFGFNRTLSENRAKAIVDQLIARHGVDRGRLAYAGVADLAPIATNDTDAGRLRNRRVELVRR